MTWIDILLIVLLGLVIVVSVINWILQWYAGRLRKTLYTCDECGGDKVPVYECPCCKKHYVVQIDLKEVDNESNSD